MTWQNIILLIAGAINLIMSIIIFSRGVKNKINLYFGLLTLFNFLWAGSLLVGRIINNRVWYDGGALLAYPAALGIAVTLYYFSIYFPAVVMKKVKIIFNYVILTLALILSIIPYVGSWFILSHDKDILNQEYTLFVNKPTYILYSAFFIAVVLLAIYNFYFKQKMMEGIFKKQIRILLFTIILGLMFGSYFDLILCYFGNYRYIWLGPIFTVFMNIYVFYLIFHTREK